MQVSALQSFWEKEWLAFLPVLIIHLLFLLRYSGALWGAWLNWMSPPHNLPPWKMACLPHFPILGLTWFLLMGSVGKLSNLSPQLLHFRQKKCDLFPTKENWDSDSSLTGIYKWSPEASRPSFKVRETVHCLLTQNDLGLVAVQEPSWGASRASKKGKKKRIDLTILETNPKT